MQRVKEPATAELLTKNLPKTSILEVMAISSTTDSNDPTSDKDFGSNTGDRVIVKDAEMLSVATIMNLPKGQAFAMIEGGQLWKIRMPLPVEDKDDMMPASLQELANNMRANYRTGENWWEGVNNYQPNAEVMASFDELNKSRFPIGKLQDEPENN